MMRPHRRTDRRVGTRPRRRQILVYTGGLRTEPAYLTGLIRHGGQLGVAVTVKSKGLDPRQLVHNAAAFIRRSQELFDEVWCVVDVDEFDIGAAVAEARRAGVSLAVSNPCFELWLLLHHADCRGYCAGYEDVVVRLKKHVPGYDKARLDFADYAPGIGDATKRAMELGDDHSQNPSTGMWRLVEMIRERR
jgi:hypothetical protein